VTAASWQVTSYDCDLSELWSREKGRLNQNQKFYWQWQKKIGTIYIPELIATSPMLVVSFLWLATGQYSPWCYATPPSS